MCGVVTPMWGYSDGLLPRSCIVLGLVVWPVCGATQMLFFLLVLPSSPYFPPLSASFLGTPSLISPLLPKPPLTTFAQLSIQLGQVYDTQIKETVWIAWSQLGLYLLGILRLSWPLAPALLLRPPPHFLPRHRSQPPLQNVPILLHSEVGVEEGEQKKKKGKKEKKKEKKKKKRRKKK